MCSSIPFVLTHTSERFLKSHCNSFHSSKKKPHLQSVLHTTKAETKKKPSSTAISLKPIISPVRRINQSLKLHNIRCSYPLHSKRNSCRTLPTQFTTTVPSITIISLFIKNCYHYIVISVKKLLMNTILSRVYPSMKVDGCIASLIPHSLNSR